MTNGCSWNNGVSGSDPGITDTGCQLAAANVSYDNSVSGLPCAHVQCALDNLAETAGAGDHDKLQNRDLDEQHPQNAIIGLVDDQAAQDALIAANEANISTNTGNIATNTGNIATNTSDLSAHTGNSDIHFDDAPADGNPYARQDNAWTPAADPSTILTGYKNVLINGDFRINQRGFDGDWTTATPGAYGYDRWYRSTNDSPGQEFKVQAIEPDNLVDGQYVLSGEGSAINTVRRLADDTVIASGQYPLKFTYNKATDAGITVSIHHTNEWAQLEQGWDATNFEVRSYGLELSLCERFYYVATSANGSIKASTSNDRIHYISFPTSMRVAPAISDHTWTGGGVVAIAYVTTKGASARTAVGNNTTVADFIGCTFDAEI